MRTLTLWLVAGLVGCGELTTDDPDETVDPGPKPVFVGQLTPGEATVRRLSASQYRHAIRDLFGPDVIVSVRPEADASVDGLVALGVAETSITQRGVELFEQVAYDLAAQARGNEAVWSSIVPCEPEGTVDEVCFATFARSFGRMAWRRPLDTEEVDRLVDIAVLAAETLGSAEDGIVYEIATILQSPAFLFRDEVGIEDAQGVRKYTDLELASRLAFFLWDTLPDDELLMAAEAGELSTDAGLSAQVERMLADPRAEDGLRALVDDVYRLREVPAISKDPLIFEHMSPTLGVAAREQTLRDIAWLVLEEDGDFRDLLTMRTTHLDPELAAVYAVKAPSREGFARVELPEDDERAGLLGQISFLALNAHPVSSSATLRGKFVRERVLCHPIPPPPANVDTSIPEPNPDAPTLRDRVAIHLESPACASCHQITDPMGLAFEHFDGLGRWRDTDNGATLDVSGDVDGDAFADHLSLGKLLAEHPDTPACTVRNVFIAAAGREPEAGEQEALDWLSETYAWSGYRLKALLTELVMSDAFRTVGPLDGGAP